MKTSLFPWRSALVFLIGLPLTSLAHADTYQANASRNWERIPIPGAMCGDGNEYALQVSRGDPNKIAFEFMGGGACWSFSTCFGPTPLTIIHELPVILGLGGFKSHSPAKSPVADYTMVYFPYCTGDVHIGDHVEITPTGLRFNITAERTLSLLSIFLRTTPTLIL
jgi:hypothetical protein